jgi:UPF0755 protein
MFKKIFFIFILIASPFFIYKYQINKETKTEDIVYFKIERGEKVDNIARRLEEQKVISSSFFFKLYLKFSDKGKMIREGEYIIPNQSNIKELAVIFSTQQLKKEKKITVREGLPNKEIEKYLVNNNLILDNKFFSLANQSIESWNFSFSKPDFLKDVLGKASLEGFLFPDTYRLYESDGSEELIEKMLNNFDKKLSKDLRNEISKQNKIILEVITMASILEKEVRTEKDMRMVADLFWRRIENNQRLQSCATLAYALGVNKSQFTYEDTLFDSPYNTYRNDGLPPGPINNPGLQAIKAAIYPLKNDYNYFLSRPDTGETIFSKTYEEHNRNKAKYLK